MLGKWGGWRSEFTLASVSRSDGRGCFVKLKTAPALVRRMEGLVNFIALLREQSPIYLSDSPREQQ